MSESSGRNTIAVRLEGGLGDHILGLRVLRFLRRRYPRHEIIGYSDSGGYRPPLEAASMSPYFNRVLPVARLPVDDDNWGELSAVLPEWLAAMHSAEIFVDGWTSKMFVEAALVLDVPVFDILAERRSPDRQGTVRIWATRVADKAGRMNPGFSSKKL
jgi:hypothetical protein